MCRIASRLTLSYARCTCVARSVRTRWKRPPMSTAAERCSRPSSVPKQSQNSIWTGWYHPKSSSHQLRRVATILPRSLHRVRPRTLRLRSGCPEAIAGPAL
ncbi:unnamed protein product, partial [Ixodes pacificus]